MGTRRTRCPGVWAPPLRGPGTMVPRGAVTARGEHGPFKSGAAMICLVLGLFAGLFHSGTERDGTPGPVSEDQGPRLPWCLRARDLPSPGETPRLRAQARAPPVSVPSAPEGRGQDPPCPPLWDPGNPPCPHG